jgi:hypothetical protein
MLKYLLVLLVVVVAATMTIIGRADNCRFAHDYSTSDLVVSSSLRDDFLRTYTRWEANFIHQVGVDKITGLTLDGIRVDVTTG